jgi:hypothetical protein
VKEEKGKDMAADKVVDDVRGERWDSHMRLWWGAHKMLYAQTLYRRELGRPNRFLSLRRTHRHSAKTPFRNARRNPGTGGHPMQTWRNVAHRNRVSHRRTKTQGFTNRNPEYYGGTTTHTGTPLHCDHKLAHHSST